MSSNKSSLFQDYRKQNILNSEFHDMPQGPTDESIPQFHNQQGRNSNKFEFKTQELYQGKRHIINRGNEKPLPSKTHGYVETKQPIDTEKHDKDKSLDMSKKMKEFVERNTNNIPNPGKKDFNFSADRQFVVVEPKPRQKTRSRADLKNPEKIEENFPNVTIPSTTAEKKYGTNTRTQYVIDMRKQREHFEKQNHYEPQDTRVIYRNKQRQQFNKK